MPKSNEKERGDTKQKRGTPTVSRVSGDTLVELVYDPTTRKTALVVSRFGGLWNIEQEVILEGELLIPYSATNNLIATECVLLPTKPEEYRLKHELIADIQAFLHRYVDLSPHFEQIAAYYVLLSWVHDAFGELPYLRLRGDYGTGKTRGLMAIGSLCYKPFFASGASTTSPLFHTLNAFGGTLILDEADFTYSDAKADITKLLNNGSVRGMFVLRCVPNQHKEYNPFAFKVFGPKIIAMRESFQDRALESRFLTEETGTRPLRPDIPIHLSENLKAEALQLRNRLLHFRLSEFFKIKTDTSALMEGVDPRLNQTALSLLSLVDDPSVRSSMQVVFVAQNESIVAERRETPEAGVLSAIMEVFSKSQGSSISIHEITECFNAAHRNDYGYAVQNKWIGGIVRTRLHLETRKSHGIYVLSASDRTKIEALCHRHGVAIASMKQTEELL